MHAKNFVLETINLCVRRMYHHATVTRDMYRILERIALWVVPSLSTSVEMLLDYYLIYCQTMNAWLAG